MAQIAVGAAPASSPDPTSDRTSNRVQETIRARRAYDRFEGRSSVRTWLYRIATNVCLDAVHERTRRARPMGLGPSSTVTTATLSTSPEATWLEPVPDGRVVSGEGDPATAVEVRETIRLAFVAALLETSVAPCSPCRPTTCGCRGSRRAGGGTSGWGRRAPARG